MQFTIAHAISIASVCATVIVALITVFPKINNRSAKYVSKDSFDMFSKTINSRLERIEDKFDKIIDKLMD